MALSTSILSGMIKSEIENNYGPADDAARLQQFCDAIAKAIVTHIKSNAVVTTMGVQAGGSTVMGEIS